LKIIYLVNVDWFFLSHRLPIALEVLKTGAEVWVITANTGRKEEIESYGFRFVDFPFSRRGTNLLFEILKLPRLYKLYKKIKPDLVHHVTIKPVIYGSLVARRLENVKVVNAITGMGFSFSEDEKATKISALVKKAYRIALNNKNVRVIFQNEKDLEVFLNEQLIEKDQATLIRGSGVNCSLFKPSQKKSDKKIVLLASRMIWDKGIKEFVEAAKIVKEQIPDVQFILAGTSDKGNPNVVSEKILLEWNKEGNVEWLGHVNDMVKLIQNSTLVTLPTYYPEGVPKILIESASTGKPIITTNRPGCNDIVKDNENGLLIPEKDSVALANAIMSLINNPQKMEELGKRGREMVLEEYSEDIVVSKTIDLYELLLEDFRVQTNANS
jgi:glycosyltransferase involved in cell wall biosynthesis